MPCNRPTAIYQSMKGVRESSQRSILGRYLGSAQRPLMCGRHWLHARPSPHPTLRRTNTTPGLAVAAAAELGSSRCWLPNRRSLGGAPPSRTPPASGVRGDTQFHCARRASILRSKIDARLRAASINHSG
jgi:hypothetical protein